MIFSIFKLRRILCLERLFIGINVSKCKLYPKLLFFPISTRFMTLNTCVQNHFPQEGFYLCILLVLWVFLPKEIWISFKKVDPYFHHVSVISINANKLPAVELQENEQTQKTAGESKPNIHKHVGMNCITAW